MNTKELIDNLREDTLHIVEQVETQIKPLSQEMLTFKSEPKKWNILECISHMNIADRHYYDEIGKKLAIDVSFAKETFSGGALGNYFTKMMKPKENKVIPNKMKTIGKFYPVISMIGEGNNDTIDTFLNDQKLLLDLLDQAKSVDLEKVKIKSALGGWLMFKLGDAFRFIIAHNQRHVLQAMNVLEVYRMSEKES
jgi:hypothetical protein